MSDEDVFVEGSMEAKLSADRDGVYRDEILQQIRDELQTVNKTLNKGVKRDEFEQLKSMKNAMEAAEKCVAVVWNKTHAK